MKRKYKSLRLFLLALIVVSGITEMRSQALSGLYTINQGAATQGNNFNNFNDFAAAVSSLGISGPVEVDVVPFSGPYVEQVLFGDVQGASALNRITINGNDNLLTYSSSNSNQRYTMGFNAGDYYTINDLQMSGTGTYQWVLWMTNGSDYNVFSNCTFSCQVNTTTTNHLAVVMSGSGSGYTTQGNTGNYNKWIGCTTFSGYAGFWMYGNSGLGSYMYGNEIIDCEILDYYVYGIYFYYHQEILVSHNLLERPTRTSMTTTYGMYIGYTSGSIAESNTIRKLFEMNQNHSGTMYGLMFYGNTNAQHNGGPNIIRNNIITDIKWNGNTYGYYIYYPKGDFIHNTIAIEHPNGSTGLVNGIMYGTTGNLHVNSQNNLVYINKGGSSTKYGIYYGSSALVTSDNNNVWMGPAGTNNYAGYYVGTTQQSMANLQAASGQEANTYSIDPMFANVATNDLHPTNPLLNNLGIPYNVIFDNEKAIRNQTTPDIGALEFLTPNCNGTPNQFVSGATYSFCPGEIANLGIGIFHSEAGYTYQWQESTVSHVGPFNNIPGANGVFYTTPPLTQNVWYNVVMTCTAPGGGVAAPVATIQIAGVTTNTAPYYEDFEGIGKNNRLPNCSWTAPNIGTSAKTFTNAQSGNRLPHSGFSFATFEAGNGGTNYYYSNDIWLDAGITYSASLWYQTDFTGATNWTDLSIMVGTDQTPGTQNVVASTNGPAVSPVYKQMGNTFTVSSSGMYNVAVRAIAASGAAQFLSWDDLRISIPCSDTHNPVNVVMNAPTTTVCSGTAVNLTASGADTYSWNHGATSAAVSVTPAVTDYYTVIGTNMLTGCSGMASVLIFVKQSPIVTMYAIPPTACAGQPITLIAGGASTYTWSSGGNGSIKIVNPTASGGYTVLGSFGGCSSKASMFITVNPLPNITAFSSSPVICDGEPVILTGSGAVSYEWISSSSSNLMIGTNVTDFPPFGQTTYTVTGTDVNGCKGVSTTNVIIDECTGLSKYSSANAVKLVPNPSNGEFSVISGSNADMQITVNDVSGRLILTSEGTGTVDMDLSGFASGIYYVKVISAGSADVIKLVKE